MNIRFGSGHHEGLRVDVSHLKSARICGALIAISFAWPLYVLFFGDGAKLFGSIPSYEVPVFESFLFGLVLVSVVGFAVLFLALRAGNSAFQNIGLIMFSSLFIGLLNVPVLANLNYSAPSDNDPWVDAEVIDAYVAGGDVDIHYFEVEENQGSGKRYTFAVAASLYREFGESDGRCVGYNVVSGVLGVDHVYGIEFRPC